MSTVTDGGGDNPVDLPAFRFPLGRITFPGQFSDTQIEQLRDLIREGSELLADVLRQERRETISGEARTPGQQFHSVLQIDDAAEKVGRKNLQAFGNLIDLYLGIERSNIPQFAHCDQGVEGNSTRDHRLGDLVADGGDSRVNLFGGRHLSLPLLRGLVTRHVTGAFVSLRTGSSQLRAWVRRAASGARPSDTTEGGVS